jgi:ABC-2 type transport system permease protein
MIVIPEGGPGTTDATTVQIVADRYRTSQLRGAVETARARLTAEVDGRPSAFAYHTNEQSLKVNLFTLALPGLLALALLQLGIFGTATPLVMARQKGTLLHLCLTPVRRGYLLAAQLVLRMTVALLQIAMILGIAILGFGVEPTAGVISYVGVSILGAAMLVALGYALAGLVPAKDSGLSLITLLNFLLMFAGGVFFDPSTSPLWPLPLFLPVAYLADAGRQLIGGTPGMVPLWVDLAAMVGFTVVAATVAIRTFRFAGGK